MHCLLPCHGHMIENSDDRESVYVCVTGRGNILFCPHLSLKFQALSAPYKRCGSCAVWMASFKNQVPSFDNLSPAVQFPGRRSWLQSLSWLGRLTVGVVALDGIQYSPVLSHISITRILLSVFAYWTLLVASMCVSRGWQLHVCVCLREGSLTS